MSNLPSRLAIFVLLAVSLTACTTEPTADTVEEAPALGADLAVEEGTATAPVEGARVVTDSLASPAPTAQTVATTTPPAPPPAEEAKAPVKNKRKKQGRYARVSFAETVHNYGVIMEGDKVQHTFNFKNTGRADLLITDVKASCGCTQPSYPFVPIAPGETGQIAVVFDSKGKLGRQKNEIAVVTNARPRTHQLYLKGTVDTERENQAPAPVEKEVEKEVEKQ
ncbi:MAG: DUF1573 domain-containing protein [Bacteroidota bacterium]